MAIRSITLNGAFTSAGQDTAMRGSATPPRRRSRRTPQIVRGAEDNYLEAWQNVDSKHLSAVALAKEEGVPLAVARKAFGEDPKPIIEELNEVLVA